MFDRILRHSSVEHMSIKRSCGRVSDHVSLLEQLCSTRAVTGYHVIL